MATTDDFSVMLDLNLSLHWKLRQELPALIDAVNLRHATHPKTGDPLAVITMPSDDNILLGLQTAMLDRELQDLPVLACGAYIRKVTDSMEQEADEVIYVATIDVYLGNTSQNDITVQSFKWAIVLNKFVRDHGWDVYPDVHTDATSDTDVSYTLDRRGDEFRQLVTLSFVFETVE